MNFSAEKIFVCHPSGFGRTCGLAGLAIAALVAVACAGREGGEGGAAPAKTVIQNAGSDTMVNLAQAWAEEYAAVHPEVSVEVSGGGTGTGIAALINGTVDLVNASRKMEPDEIEKATREAGAPPQEYVVGHDALAVYVNLSNPLEEISIAQLAGIYGQDGTTDKWSQLGVRFPGCDQDQIIRISRQSNSGTYHYFREALLGTERDLKLGSLDLHGSKDVVEVIGRTPCAIGYSGMGYATANVKTLRVARQPGEPAIAPTVENTQDNSYPIARPLYIYTHGVPSAAVRAYLDWVRSEAGQRIVAETGYVPLTGADPKPGSGKGAAQ
ncbi:MAG: phosphate ABC transporter substrate-binding protein [Acidobacteria bacterium]|nr:phosphate ABC transporter substrate-binding protein [Acidobacteriota bacterium]